MNKTNKLFNSRPLNKNLKTNVMFNSKTKSSFNETALASTTIIGVGTVINGDIESNSDIRIDGTLIGNITSKSKILIGPDGIVNGDIKGQHADVSGKISGKIKVNDLLQLRDNANVQGDIYAGKLQIEPSATFNGQCHMGANIVELNAEISNAINQ
jgi:cytoskeletal protein CcmA (bactofilin family)